jgi:hypothetical protein
MAAERDGIVFDNADVVTWDPVLVGLCSNHFAAGFLFEVQVAANMIAVVVRVEYKAKLPVIARQHVQDRLGEGGIYDGGFPRCRIVKQIAVIVVKHRDDGYIEHGMTPQWFKMSGYLL